MCNGRAKQRLNRARGALPAPSVVTLLHRFLQGRVIYSSAVGELMLSGA